MFSFEVSFLFAMAALGISAGERGCQVTTQESYPCSVQRQRKTHTQNWCWDITHLFSCMETKYSKEMVWSTCYRQGIKCCPGYGGADCQPSCGWGCDNGGECVAPNTCRCKTGYTGSTCGDVDECAHNNGGCSHICTNTHGSYKCACNRGYHLAQNGLACQDIDECAVDGGPCSHSCVNTPGSYQCRCPAGFSLLPDRHTCLDDDECSDGNGGCSHQCVNLPGSHYCQCPQGLTLHANLTTCVEIDSCVQEPCLNAGVCINEDGNFTCNCTLGFTGRLCQHGPGVTRTIVVVVRVCGMVMVPVFVLLIVLVCRYKRHLIPALPADKKQWVRAQSQRARNCTLALPQTMKSWVPALPADKKQWVRAQSQRARNCTLDLPQTMKGWFPALPKKKDYSRYLDKLPCRSKKTLHCEEMDPPMEPLVIEADDGHCEMEPLVIEADDGHCKKEPLVIETDDGHCDEMIPLVIGADGSTEKY